MSKANCISITRSFGLRQNNGQVPQYYVEGSHPAIIDKEMWEAVQLEMERRRDFALEYGIQKLEYATTDNPFAGRVICGSCGQVFGRKVWNSTDDRFRRVIWRCNGKYVVKGKKGCDSRHIDDGVLYQAFLDVFRTLVENRDFFMKKWQERLANENALVRYKAKQFMGVLEDAEVIDEFDAELYFALVEKMTVCVGGRMVVSLLDGTAVECPIE